MSSGPGVAMATARRLAWRLVFAASGGLRVEGRLSGRPSILVANHSSHADTAALLAALPARRRPAVAAAADYWFAGPVRAAICQLLVGGFPVRRAGGGSSDLDSAARMLADGRDVIVFPEGTRSREGAIGTFRSGAAVLAARTGAPLVPVGIDGTRQLLPVHGRVHRTQVTIRIGAPVNPGVSGPKSTSHRDTAAAARAAVAELATAGPSGGAGPGPGAVEPRSRQVLARLAGSRLGLVAVAAWAFAEALSWPLLPEFLLVILAVAVPRSALRLAVVAAAASLAGGALMYTLAAHGTALPAPLTTSRMHTTAATQVRQEGAGAVRHQPMSGIPYKLYGSAAGQAGVGLPAFVAASAATRGSRILAIGALAGLVGVGLRRRPRWYPAFLALFATTFAAGLTAVVISWR